jgi:hypothetical protein
MALAPLLLRDYEFNVLPPDLNCVAGERMLATHFWGSTVAMARVLSKRVRHHQIEDRGTIAAPLVLAVVLVVFVIIGAAMLIVR